MYDSKWTIRALLVVFCLAQKSHALTASGCSLHSGSDWEVATITMACPAPRVVEITSGSVIPMLHDHCPVGNECRLNVTTAVARACQGSGSTCDYQFRAQRTSNCCIMINCLLVRYQCVQARITTVPTTTTTRVTTRSTSRPPSTTTTTTTTTTPTTTTPTTQTTTQTTTTATTTTARTTTPTTTTTVRTTTPTTTPTPRTTPTITTPTTTRTTTAPTTTARTTTTTTTTPTITTTMPTTKPTTLKSSTSADTTTTTVPATTPTTRLTRTRRTTTAPKITSKPTTPGPQTSTDVTRRTSRLLPLPAGDGQALTKSVCSMQSGSDWEVASVTMECAPPTVVGITSGTLGPMLHDHCPDRKQRCSMNITTAITASCLGAGSTCVYSFRARETPDCCVMINCLIVRYQCVQAPMTTTTTTRQSTTTTTSRSTTGPKATMAPVKSGAAQGSVSLTVGVGAGSGVVLVIVIIGVLIFCGQRAGWCRSKPVEEPMASGVNNPVYDITQAGIVDTNQYTNPSYEVLEHGARPPVYSEYQSAEAEELYQTIASKDSEHIYDVLSPPSGIPPPLYDNHSKGADNFGMDGPTAFDSKHDEWLRTSNMEDVNYPHHAASGRQLSRY